MIKAIIFDLFNTLAYIDTKDYEDTKYRMASQIGVDPNKFIKVWKKLAPLSNKGVLITVEDRVLKTLEKMNVRPNYNVVKSISEMEEELQKKYIKLFPLTKTVLQELKNEKFKIAIISNCASISGDAVEKLSIKEYFDTIILSFQEGIVKPEREIYILACKKLGVAPEECMFVGDGDDNELEGAKKVGMNTVLIYTSRKNLVLKNQRSHIDYLISNLQEISRIISKIKS
jgi:putative hydrolase of the HAD superfamily